MKQAQMTVINPKWMLNKYPVFRAMQVHLQLLDQDTV